MLKFQVDFDVNKFVVHELIDHWDPIGMLVGGYYTLERMKQCPIFQKCTKNAEIIYTADAKRMIKKLEANNE